MTRNGARDEGLLDVRRDWALGRSHSCASGHVFGSGSERDLEVEISLFHSEIDAVSLIGHRP